MKTLTCLFCLGLIPGPLTNSGTLLSKSYNCLLSNDSENWPKTEKPSLNLYKSFRDLLSPVWY